MTTFQHASIARLVCVALVSLLLPRVEAAQQIQKKPLQAYIDEVTGRESVVNCGEYAVSTLPSKEALQKSLSCADDSVKQRKPSRTVLHVQGRDSALAHGVLSDAMGRAFFFEYDSAPCGGPMCAERFEKKVCRVSEVEILAYGTEYRLGLKR